MSKYRVYYLNLVTDEEVVADGAQPMNLPNILELMDRILTEWAHYVGVVDADGGLLQFIVQEDGSLQLDFPSPKERGSYMKLTDMEECKAVLQASGDLFDRSQVDGLSFDRW